MKFSKVIIAQMSFLVLALTWGSAVSLAADPVFFSTSDPTGHWFVSANVAPSCEDGSADIACFNTNSGNFIQAVNLTTGGRADWIADNATAYHGGIGNYTFFVFRQTFDLTGFDPSTADLQFQWAADDSGQGFADRGTWTPKFSLNGGGLVAYPGSPTDTYSYSSTVDLASGFVAGKNTIDFYVEGNGQTDGFALRTMGFTAGPAPVVTPEPASMVLFGVGGAAMAFMRRRKA